MLKYLHADVVEITTQLVPLDEAVERIGWRAHLHLAPYQPAFALRHLQLESC